MDKIVVKGGARLTGEVTISGAKNAALPLLASSILVDGVTEFENVPALMDVKSIKVLLEDFGAVWTGSGSKISVDCSAINKFEAEYDLVRKMRASVLVLGPLVSRFGYARVSLPGGCAIGARPVDMHLRALKVLGAEIDVNHGYIEARADRLMGNEVYFDLPTVTGTENIMMAAVLARGTTILRNSAREPEVVALADALNQMGADIKGAGTAVITIHGVDALKPARIRVIPDRIEAGTFMVAAAATKGDILVRDCEPDHMGGIISKLKQSGCDVTITPRGVRVTSSGEILSTDFKTFPYPGFPTDMQAQFMVLMAVAEKNSVIHETIFENRFMHVNELQRMGADISISGGRYAMIRGVKELSGAPVMASDLRASASLVIAGLIARGTTTIHRVYHLDRGYDAIEKKFSALGADITRIK
ncbi:MAG: UDP-N-acetylglucosamine 1-carboxyvinyltransferase [Thermodesulfobacteriota bacterium]|nr:UDP-N-acetylglucosamine 1-carboxyvinyltransferase [Thermodesulfobacteriota bacterium]